MCACIHKNFIHLQSLVKTNKPSSGIYRFYTRGQWNESVLKLGTPTLRWHVLDHESLIHRLNES